MSAPAAIFSILVAALIFWLAWKYDWFLDAGEREFNEAYRSRKPLSDDAMIELYFQDSPIDPNVAITVRKITAEQLQYERERLLPDDDFMFVFAEVDAIEFIMELEEAFDIEIPDSDSSKTPPTIRAMAELVRRKLNEKAVRGGGFPG
jgi:acyl carrier protein